MWMQELKRRVNPFFEKLYRDVLKISIERPPTVCREVLKIENRLQMFCYYNTLAWAILAATLASDIVFATLPFGVASSALRSKVLCPVILVCVVLPLGGGLAVYHLRNLAARWISFPLEGYWKDDPMSLRKTIDYVEAGNWEMCRPPRACPTYAVMIGLLAVVEWISAYLWLSVSGLLWLWLSVGAVILLAALFAICWVCDP
jgi:hypothetical protein